MKAQGVPTFREATAKMLAQHRKTWRNEKHEAQWLRTLEAYVFPHLGNVQVSEINGPMIRNVLAEIWLAKPETARRVRQRIGTVLDWAYASGYRDTEAGDQQGVAAPTQEGGALCGHALCQGARIHSEAERTRELQPPGAGGCDSDCSTIGRGAHGGLL
jgi:integrase